MKHLEDKNRKLHGGKGQDPQLILELAVLKWKEFLNVSVGHNAISGLAPQSRVWTAPASGRLKLNTTVVLQMSKRHLLLC